jgi:hypothetical protein
MIAQRTKDRAASRKGARGVVLGNPKLANVRDRAVASVKADADRFAKNVAPIIREIQSAGATSHRGIARSLNARGVATARGGAWTAVQVGSILRRAALRRPLLIAIQANRASSAGILPLSALGVKETIGKNHCNINALVISKTHQGNNWGNIERILQRADVPAVPRGSQSSLNQK